MGWLTFIRRTVSLPYFFLAVGALISLFVAAFDSFRLSSSSDRVGAETVGALLAPLYPTGHALDARAAISTLLLTQDSMARLGLDTPYLPYDVQGDLLSLIAAAKPRAIFLDFTYRRAQSDPQGLAYFTQAVAAAKAAGVPVILGNVSEDPAFDALRATASVADVRWLAEQPLDYPFFGATGAETPAAQIYQDICATEDGRARFACDLNVTNTLPAIAVEWARGASPDLERWWGAVVSGCAGRDESGIATAFLENLARNVFRRLAQETSRAADACTYHESAPIDLVLNEATGDAALAQLAAGRVVMIGSALGDDELETPGQGVAPGVVHHAMALDNLLTRGARYQRWSAELAFGPARIGINNLLEILLSLGVGLGAASLMRAHDKKDVARTAWMFALTVVLGVAIPILAALLGRLMFYWTAVNVFGVAAAAFGVSSVLEHERLGAAISRLTVRIVIVACLILTCLVTLFAAVFIAGPGDEGVTYTLGAVCAALAITFLVFGRTTPLRVETRANISVGGEQ